MAEEGVPPAAGLDLGGMDAQEEEAETGWSPPKTLPHVTNWVRGASAFYATVAIAGAFLSLGSVELVANSFLRSSGTPEC